MIKKIDHIAIAVKDLEKEIKRYREVLGLEYLGREIVEEQKVEVAFFRVGNVLLELTTPTAEDSPVHNFLKKREGGIHHISFEVENIETKIEEFEKKGVVMLNREPKAGAHKAKIAFAHPKSFSGVLLELKEKEE